MNFIETKDTGNLSKCFVCLECTSCREQLAHLCISLQTLRFPTLQEKLTPPFLKYRTGAVSKNRLDVDY